MNILPEGIQCVQYGHCMKSFVNLKSARNEDN